jgi:hypothetical protein
MNMVKVAPDDPWCGLADEKDLARDFPDLSHLTNRARPVTVRQP